MAIRASDGIYLEVLASAPVAGVPIEIDVYGGNNIATMLTTLEGAQEPAFTDPFGDIGSGHFRIPVTDPKATGAIIRSGNYVKGNIAGVSRYAFFRHNPRRVVASPARESGECRAAGGRVRAPRPAAGGVGCVGWGVCVDVGVGFMRQFLQWRSGAVLACLRLYAVPALHPVTRRINRALGGGR